MLRSGATPIAATVLLTLAVVIASVIPPCPAQASSWSVRQDGTGDFAAIQDAIDAAADGDSLLVGPGRYFERLWIEAKRVHLLSTDGPAATILDGGVSETRPEDAVIHCFFQGQAGGLIEGFTIQNGHSGIQCTSASPVIRRNVIQNNHGPLGAGISALFDSAPLIEENLIRENYTKYECCFPSRGGGIYADESSPAWIRRNVIADNHCNGLCVGGGISVFIATVEENTIVGNRCDGPGGGVEVAGEGAILYANIIAMNRAAEFGDGVMVVRSATLICNDVWSNGEEDYWGTAPGDGDFSADPLFCDPLAFLGDRGASATMERYGLLPESPCLPGQHPGGGPCETVGAIPAGCDETSSPSSAGEPDGSRLGAAAGCLAVTPNPTSSGARLSLPAANAVPETTIDILSASGRVIARALRIDSHSFYWDGRTSDGAAAPAGVYYARLAGGGRAGSSARAPIVVVR